MTENITMRNITTYNPDRVTIAPIESRFRVDIYSILTYANITPENFLRCVVDYEFDGIKIVLGSDNDGYMTVIMDPGFYLYYMADSALFQYLVESFSRFTPVE